MSILWLKSTIRRVCVSSPPSRTSLATGKSLGALAGAADGPMRSAADAPPKTSPPKRSPLRTIALKGKARILTRTDMGGPYEPVVLHYGGAVNKLNFEYRAKHLIRQHFPIIGVHKESTGNPRGTAGQTYRRLAWGGVN